MKHFKLNVDGSLLYPVEINAGGIVKDWKGEWFGGLQLIWEKGGFLMLNAGFSYLGFNLQRRKGKSQILIEMDSALSAIAVQLVTIVNDVSCHPLATIIGRCS